MAVALFFCAYSTINFYAIQNPNHLKHFTQKEARIQNAASFIRYCCRKAIFAAPVLLATKLPSLLLCFIWNMTIAN